MLSAEQTLAWLAAAILIAVGYGSLWYLRRRTNERKAQAIASDKYFETMEQIVRDKETPDHVVEVCHSLGVALVSPRLGRSLVMAWLSGQLARSDGNTLRRELEGMDKVALSRVLTVFLNTLVASTYNNGFIGWAIRKYVLTLLTAVPQNAAVVVSRMQPQLERKPHQPVAA